jgi:hypothetical protein
MAEDAIFRKILLVSLRIAVGTISLPNYKNVITEGEFNSLAFESGMDIRQANTE